MGGACRVDVIYPELGERTGDGVRDHGEQLVRALNHAGHHARHVAWATPDCNVAFLQYTPFTWGRHGLAPDLPRRIASLYRRSPRPLIALMVHEPYLSDGPWRHRLLGLAQREQLRLVASLADVVLVSIEPWQRMLEGWRGARPVSHLPVGSNLPDARDTRAATRRELGFAPDDIVIAAFDSPHPGRSRSLLEAGVRAAAEAGAAHILLLGAHARPGPEMRLPALVPGVLSADRLSSHLAVADVFLAPFVDGVSTRRTTLIAALQHGLPVVGTIGHLTDPELTHPRTGILVAPVDEPSGFASAVASLVRDPQHRCAVGHDGREFYDKRFAWPVLLEILSQALSSAGPRRLVTL